MAGHRDRSGYTVTDVYLPTKGQCRAEILKRDTYRYTGGRNRFALHYSRVQCGRKAGPSGYCWQHAPVEEPSDG